MDSTPPKSLAATQIDRLRESQRKIVRVDEWGDSVEIVALQSLDMLTLHEEVLQLPKAGPDATRANIAFAQRLLSKTLVGFDSDAGREVLERCKLPTLLRLSQIAMEMNGLGTGGDVPKKTA